MPIEHFPEKYIPINKTELEKEMNEILDIFKNDTINTFFLMRRNIIKNLENAKNETESLNWTLQKDKLEEMIDNALSLTANDLEKMKGFNSRLISEGYKKEDIKLMIENIKNFIENKESNFMFLQERTRKILKPKIEKIIQIYSDLIKGKNLENYIIEYLPSDVEYVNFNCINMETGEKIACAKKTSTTIRSSEFVRKKSKNNKSKNKKYGKKTRTLYFR